MCEAILQQSVGESINSGKKSVKHTTIMHHVRTARNGGSGETSNARNYTEKKKAINELLASITTEVASQRAEK